MASGTLGSLAVNLIMRTEKFDRSVKGSRHQSQLLAGTLSKLKFAAIGAGSALAASFTVRGLAQRAQELDRIAKAVDKVGASVRGFRGLESAVILGGGDEGSLLSGMLRVRKLLGEDSDAFKQIGLDIRQLKRLKAEEVFLKIADAIEKMDVNKRVSAASAIFGKGAGGKLLPTLMGGSAAIRQEIAATPELSRDELRRIEEVNDASTRLSRSFASLADTAMVRWAPTITKVVERMEEFLGKPQATPLEQWKTRLGSLSPSEFGKFRTMFNSASSTGKSEAGRKFFGEQGGQLALQQSTAVERAIRDREDSMVTAHEEMVSKQVALFTRLRERGMAPVNKFLGTLGDSLERLGSISHEANIELWSLMKQGAWRTLTGQGALSPMAAAGTPGGQKAFDDMQRRMVPSLSMPETRGNAALEKGTAAAFSQERRSSQQGLLVDLTRKNEKNTAESKEILKSIDRSLLNNQIATEAAGLA